MTSSSPQKVALVCDWLTVVGGAEQVLREIHKLYPKAPIYTSQYRPKKIDWMLKLKLVGLIFSPPSQDVSSLHFAKAISKTSI